MAADATASPTPAARRGGGGAGDDHRIVLRGVRHRFAGRSGSRLEALAPLDLEIAAGEFVAIVGPSGCGKTTLLRLVAGLLPPSEGVVEVGGVRVRGPSSQRGVVFQHPNLYPWLSVRDNVAFGPRMRGAGRAERRRIADDHLALVGLADFADAAPYELSGGMQQRCQIAAVLANDPAIMLLDEPFGALDALTRDRLQDELHRIWLGSGKTAVFITHSVEEAVYLATRVLVMTPRPGRLVLDEPVPFPAGERVAALRLTPDFVAFRERIANAVRAD